MGKDYTTYNNKAEETDFLYEHETDADAQYNFGICSLFGRGVEQSYAEAAKWFRKAAEQGHAEAQYNLGYCYYNGYGVERSYEEAAECYRKAAEQGYEKAIQKLKTPDCITDDIKDNHNACKTSSIFNIIKKIFNS